MLIDALAAAVAPRVAELVIAQFEERTGPGEWLNVEEAAEYARCSTGRIYDLRSSGRLPKTGDGSRALIRRADVDAYLADRRAGA